MIFLIANKLLKILSRISAKKGYEYVAKMSDEDLVRNVGYLAHALRDVRKRGAGVSVFPLKLSFLQAYKVFRRKEASSATLYPFENRIKENYRLLFTTLEGIRFDRFVALPHCDGVPRILILADFIVRYSGNLVTESKIRTVVDAFNAVTPLRYSEIESLIDAIRFRLLSESAIFCERAIEYYLNSLRAKRKHSLNKFRSSDSFLTYYASYHGISPDAGLPKDIDWQGAKLGFDNLLADNDLLLSRYIESLRNLPKGTDAFRFVRLSKTDAIYSHDVDYRNMSDSSKRDYLMKTEEVADRLSFSEEVVANAAITLGKNHGVHFGEILFRHFSAMREYLRSGRIVELKCNERIVQGGYAALVLMLSLGIAAFPAYYWHSVLSFFAVLPLFIILLHPVEYLMKRWMGARVKSRPLPQMDYPNVPEESATVVVASRFIASVSDAEDAKLQIETLRASCMDPCVSYLVLADFPSSDREFDERDENLLAYIREMTLSENVSFMIRKRVRKGVHFVARERKRGAILDLFSAIISRSADGFYLIGSLPRAKYAILLDDDSELLPGSIRSAIMSMAHPLNQGYDLMAFGGKINRFSISTYYADRFSRTCGVDVYPFYSDFYADRFDCALYCGKAIVRIEQYLRKLNDFFPEGRILSHDIIEGAVLRSASLKRCVYEDAPTTFSVDCLRTSRWQRGDVQLLPYAFCNRVKNREGKKIKNPIQPIYKLILFINGFSVLRDAMTAGMMIACFFVGDLRLMAYVLISHLSIYIYSFLASFRIIGKVRFDESLREIGFALWLLTESLIMIPFRALNGLYIFVMTSLKMAFRSKNLLEWKPFHLTQQIGGYDDGAKLFLPSCIVMTTLTVFAGDLRMTLFALVFFLYAIFLILSGRAIKGGSPSKGEEDLLREQAKKIYQYFMDLSDEKLIPDNVQIFPYTVRAKMTSPTNLGFAFLAEVCAAKLGLIEDKRAIENISTMLDKTENLEKWKGHLYNWYDIKTLAVMPPRVVSTVDSANYIACLYVVWAFVKEIGEKDLAARIKTRIDETDFSALYEKEDKSLPIVRNISDGHNSGHYDLLASEARLAYYFAISQGVDPESYFRLGRDVSPLYHNTLLSWSGTAFEYRLPGLFLEAPRGSLLYEQERRSGKVQMLDKTQGLFGRSECGYHDFNDAVAYRYKAVGCAALALSGEESDVIAPYATYLYLPMFPKTCLENLNRLRHIGAEGRYGLYEAIDFEKEGRIVQSFMTHHQGMSLAAITNRLCGNALIRLFSLSPEMRSIRLLLAEEDIHTKAPKVYEEKYHPEEKEVQCVECPTAVPGTVCFSSEEYTLVVDALGRSKAKWDKYCLNGFFDYKEEKGGIFIQIKEEDAITSPTYYPCGDFSCKSLFMHDSVRFVNEKAHCEMEVYPLRGYAGELRKITIMNAGDVERSLDVSVYSDMVLNTEDAYDSHPAYSDMFLRAEYDPQKSVSYLIRRDGEGNMPIAAAMMVKGVEEVKSNCNAYNVIGRQGDYREDYGVGVRRQEAPPFGDVLYPCFAFSGKVTIPAREKRSVYVVLLGADSRDILRDRVEKLDLAYRGGAIDLLGRSDIPSEIDLPLLLSVCGKLCFGARSKEMLSSRYEMRDSFPLLGIDPAKEILYFGMDYSSELFEKTTSVSKYLQKCGVSHVLVIGCNRLKGAGMDSIEVMQKKLRERGVAGVVLSDEQAEKIRKCATVDCADLDRDKKELLTRNETILPEDCFDKKDLSMPAGEGGFTADGYRVIPYEKETLLPYANVVAAREGGFVITERGGGFTFGSNAREDKFTVWSGDALGDFPSERLLLSLGEKLYRINASSCLHKIGSSVFTAEIEGVTLRSEVYLLASGRVKVYETILSEDLPSDARLKLSLTLALGWRYSDRILALQEDRGIKLIRVDTGKAGFLYSPDGDILFGFPEKSGDPMEFILNKPLKKGVYRFLFGMGEKIDLCERERVISRAKTLSEMYKNAIEVRTQNKDLDRLNNRILPYQVMSSRLNGRTGFYQCGGAIGFRDQLQDTLALLISAPDICRERITDAASHQYEEGDVQHWWHPPRMGVRTRISDDRLWLVYIVERYIEVTGDHLILDEEIPFLYSPILAEGEHSRYEIPSIRESAPLREHLLRAIHISLSYGEHGLLKIGSGDWNDGLDRVGREGRGESVWLTMFARKCISDALNYFHDGERKELLSHISRLDQAIVSLMKEGRFPLAFADDGKWLGYHDSKSCTLALNPQTWAVIGECVPKEMALRALDSAGNLVDERYEIIKLSVPPFDFDSNYGYISSYPKGIRENGGQYTHAAIWYLKALLEVGKLDEGYRILQMLSPISRCDTRDKTMRYQGEPYVLAGDIYGCAPYQGRMGWSWYTGSAAWLKYVLTEDFFGIRKRGDLLYVRPKFPSVFKSCTATVIFQGKRITIDYQRGEKDGLYLNDKKIDMLNLSEAGENTRLLCRFC